MTFKTLNQRSAACKAVMLKRTASRVLVWRCLVIEKQTSLAFQCERSICFSYLQIILDLPLLRYANTQSPVEKLSENLK